MCRHWLHFARMHLRALINFERSIIGYSLPVLSYLAATSSIGMVLRSFALCYEQDITIRCFYFLRVAFDYIPDHFGISSSRSSPSQGSCDYCSATVFQFLFLRRRTPKSMQLMRSFQFKDLVSFSFVVYFLSFKI